MRSTSATTIVNTQGGVTFAKCPRWDGQSLLFLDVDGRCIKSLSLQGVVHTVQKLTFLPGGFNVLSDGDYIVAAAWRRKLFRFKSARQQQISDLSNVAKFCLSDGIIDSHDGMYVGDVGFDFQNPLVDPLPNGVIIHIGTDGKSSVVAENLFFPSGMIITPDHQTLIVAETLGHRLTAFDISRGGGLHNRRVWAQFNGDIKPGGICLDHDGAIWVAGAVAKAMCVSEGGRIEQEVVTRRPVFDTALGGPDGRNLFLCTSDSNDPVMTRQVENATIDVADVDVAGCCAN